MKKEDVLNMDILKYSRQEECPEYSNGFNEKINRCIFHFYCKNDDCTVADDNGYIQFSNNTNKLNTMNCLTSYGKFIICDGNAQCSNHTDCLSNNCYNSQCIINKESPTTECWCHYDLKRMHCGKGYMEECEKNSDCSSNECEYISNFGMKICLGFNKKTLSSGAKFPIKPVILGAIGAIIFGGIIYYFIENKPTMREQEKNTEITNNLFDNYK